MGESSGAISRVTEFREPSQGLDGQQEDRFWS